MSVKPLTKSVRILDKAALFAMVVEATVALIRTLYHENYDLPSLGSVPGNESLP